MSQKAYLPISAAKLYINNKEMEFSVLDTIIPAGLNKTGLARFALINLNNRYADIAKQAGEMILKYQIGTIEKIVMAGYIEEVKHQLQSKLIQIACTDYTGMLKTAITSEKIYRNQTDDVVVKDLISSFASWCTTNNVQSSTDNIPYLKVEEGKDLLETLQEIAKRYSKVFYVDTVKDLHWIPKSTSGTPKATLEEGVNLLDAEVNWEIGSVVNKFVLKCKIAQPVDLDFWTELLTNWEVYVIDLILNDNCDSWTSEQSPDNNYGTENFLRVQSIAGQQKYTFLKTPISVLLGATLESAVFWIYCYSEAAEPGYVILYKLPNLTWTETGITWNNQPGVGDQILTEDVNVGWVDWDVKTYVEELIAASQSVMGLSIRSSGVAHYTTFNSRESSNIPYLKVTGWLLAENYGSSLESIKKVRGSYSLKFNSSVKKARYPKQKNLALDPTKMTHFILDLLADASETITVRVHKDASNYRSATLDISTGAFQEFDLTIADMTLTGTVDQINYWELEFPKTTNTYVDKAHFEADVTVTKEDATSQSKWGVKSSGETKGCMGSQSDAEAYAQRKVDALKEPPITIDVPLTPDLLDKFYMGDTVTVKIKSADVNGDFLVADPQHTFSAEGIAFRCKLSQYRQELAEFLARTETDYLVWSEED